GTAGSKISRTTNNADLEAVAYSAYTEGEFKLTDALSITPGIRWEQVNQSRETMNAIPPGTVPNFKRSAMTQGLIYGMGVKYQLPMNTLLFGHVHTTFRPPTFANAIDPTTGPTGIWPPSAGSVPTSVSGPLCIPVCPQRWPCSASISAIRSSRTEVSSSTGERPCMRGLRPR
ncbi:MAG: TonB-dependent receptor, partial [Nitrospirales bacterium]|nr:TonB-dependent receptor [Nitrospirales bacterium]